ncbi:Uncharacterized protein TCM_006061 [Theobroma cacao]|uniref:Uncharacterized protein n=1 Tax=Theobroma cacao TaxID=3641 RepID=A0A061DWY4_THECC|nr:Uncharacterized protein TCM_006061 [Theobroma cacao]
MFLNTKDIAKDRKGFWDLAAKMILLVAIMSSFAIHGYGIIEFGVVFWNDGVLKLVLNMLNQDHSRGPWNEVIFNKKRWSQRGAGKTSVLESYDDVDKSRW